MTLVGLGLLAGVLAWYGVEDVGSAFTRAGWGLLWIILAHLAPLITDALGWRQLFRPERRPSFLRTFVYRWIGESVNNLFPVAQVGGDVVRARLAARAGVPAANSGAATVVDFTIGLLTLMAAGLTALALLTARTGFSSSAGWILLGIVLFTALILSFVAAQAWGLFGKTGHVATTFWRRMTSSASHGAPNRRGEIDAEIAEVYRRRRSIAACVLFRLGSWVLGALEVQLALYLLGGPIDMIAAFILHALTMSIRSIAFIIPAGIGAQEGGFVLVGRLLGLDGPLALTLGLIRRGREILLGLPGLAAWWLIELRRHKRRRTEEERRGDHETN